MNENIPPLIDCLQVEIRILERKIAACLYQHPGATIAKMKELNTYPESDTHVVYFWNLIQENMREILTRGDPEIFPILDNCLFDVADLQKWDSELCNPDCPTGYENHLLDMPGYIAGLKRRRALLTLYVEWLESGSFRKLMGGYS